VSALAPLRPEPVEDFAERLVRRFFRMCENPRHRRRMLAMLRNGANDEDDKKRTYERMNRVIMLPVATSLGVRTTALRAELVLSQLLGVATARYMLKVEPSPRCRPTSWSAWWRRRSAPSSSRPTSDRRGGAASPPTDLGWSSSER